MRPGVAPLLLLLAASAFAAQAPDLSGTYKESPSPKDGEVLTVQQTPEEIRLIETTSEGVFTTVVQLAGKSRGNVTHIQAPSPSNAKSTRVGPHPKFGSPSLENETARFRGDVLVIKGVSTSGVTGKAYSYYHEVAYSIVDGKLICRTFDQSGMYAAHETHVFERQP